MKMCDTAKKKQCVRFWVPSKSTDIDFIQ